MPKIEEDKTTRTIVPGKDKVEIHVTGDFKQSFTFSEILSMKQQMESNMKQSEQAIDEDFLKYHKENIEKLKEEIKRWKPAFDAAESWRAVQMKKNERKSKQ